MLFVQSEAQKRGASVDRHTSFSQVTGAANRVAEAVALRPRTAAESLYHGRRRRRGGAGGSPIAVLGQPGQTPAKALHTKA